jgi:hypothetical protein
VNFTVAKKLLRQQTVKRDSLTCDGEEEVSAFCQKSFFALDSSGTLFGRRILALRLSGRENLQKFGRRSYDVSETTERQQFSHLPRPIQCQGLVMS